MTENLNQSVEKRDELSEIKIEIDCAPGSARPDSILTMVLCSINSDLTLNDFVQTGCFFGEWTFVLKKGKEIAYLAHKEEFGKCFKDLHSNGVIRYASWT